MSTFDQSRSPNLEDGSKYIKGIVLFANVDNLVQIETPLFTMLDKPPQPHTRGRLFQVLASLIACLTSISFGFAFAYSSPVIPQLLRQKHLEADQVSWFGSIITLGAAAGGPIGGILIRFGGRKGTILTSSVVNAVSWLFILLGCRFGHLFLYTGRCLSGVGIGMVCASTPVYISEIAQSDIRGSLVSIFQLMAVVGVMIVYGLGIVLNWLWLAVFGVVLALLSAICILPCPETPRYLMSIGDSTGAAQSLCAFRCVGHDVNKELKEIEIAVKEEKSVKLSDALREMYKERHVRRILIYSMVMVFHQLNGPAPMWFFISTVFEESGYSGPEAIPPLVVSSTAIIGVLISIPMMDRFGRRSLMIFGAVLIIISSVAMGLHFYLIEHGTTLDFLPVTTLSLFVLAFYIGLASPPFALMAESFPVYAQAAASGICTLVNWTTSFIYSYFFLDLLEAITPYGTFWLISGIGMLNIIFVVAFVKETKKKSLQEISGGELSRRFSTAQSADKIVADI